MRVLLTRTAEAAFHALSSSTKNIHASRVILPVEELGTIVKNNLRTFPLSSFGQNDVQHWSETFSRAAVTRVSLQIGNVRYINILIGLRDFQDKLLFVSKSLLGIERQKKLKILQFWPETFGATLEYWYIEPCLLRFGRSLSLGACNYPYSCHGDITDRSILSYSLPRVRPPQ